MGTGSEQYGGYQYIRHIVNRIILANFELQVHTNLQYNDSLFSAGGLASHSDVKKKTTGSNATCLMPLKRILRIVELDIQPPEKTTSWWRNEFGCQEEIKLYMFQKRRTPRQT
jgi:hypothetical protein